MAEVVSCSPAEMELLFMVVGEENRDGGFAVGGFVDMQVGRSTSSTAVRKGWWLIVTAVSCGGGEKD